MEEKSEIKSYKELLDNENEDLWDIFFPYMNEKQEKIKKLEEDKSKPGRHLRFITMLF